jgi:hypothetical protein
VVRFTVLLDADKPDYAGRKLCRRGVAHWWWLGIRPLAEAPITEHLADWR